MTELVPIDERVVSSTEIPTVPPGALYASAVVVLPNDGVPTQVANPGRTVRRVVVQIIAGLIIAVPLLNTAATEVLGYLNEQDYIEVAPWVYVGLNAVLAVTGLAIGLTARLMAARNLNEWIVEHAPALSAIPLKPAEELREINGDADPLDTLH